MSNIKKLIREEIENILQENSQEWRVKDIIEMQKVHKRGKKAINYLNKFIKDLEKLDEKNVNKPNAGMFKHHTSLMRKYINQFINGEFISNLEEYEKGGKAAFQNHWK